MLMSNAEGDEDARSLGHLGLGYTTSTVVSHMKYSLVVLGKGDGAAPKYQCMKGG
jgi:hypothetical protein